jgi:hypothetical protein
MYEYGIVFRPRVGPQIYIHTPHISCTYVLSLGHIGMHEPDVANVCTALVLVLHVFSQ